MRALPLLVILSLAQPLAATPLACSNGVVTVIATEPALAERVCRASDQAISLFAECGFELSKPVEISAMVDFDENCFGVYHCGQERIELLTLKGMQNLMPEDSIFRDIPIEDFFDSIVVHELAHALYDETDCPYPNCLATSEYLAYSYQIMSLSEENRALIEADIDMERKISRDYIVGLLAAMAPDRFTQRVWQHFNQREDQCGWLDGILSGAIVFDHDYP